MVSASDMYPVQRAVLRWTAAISGLTALAAIVGWYLRLQRLVQWSPGTAPMQYNSALGILLCSVGLFLVPASVKKAVLWAGGLSALIGLTALAENLGAGDLHVDQLLFKTWLTSGTVSAGRMGMNTALCMTLAGLALTLMAVPGKRRRYSLAIALAGSSVAIVSVLAIVGYSMSLESAYRWGYMVTQMAENTTLAFLTIGVGLIVSALFDGGKGRPLHWRYTPAIVGFASVVFTILLWQALVAEENSSLARGSGAAMSQVTFEINAQMANLDGALQRIARRWPAGRVNTSSPGKSRPGEWKFDAAEYIADFPGLEALQWRDHSPDTTRAEPGSFTGHRGFFEPGVRGDGFLLTGPRAEAAADSRTTALVNYRAWLGAVLHKEVASGYSVAVAVDGQDIFDRVYGQNDGSGPRSTVSAAMDAAGKKWAVRVWPGPAVLASSASQLTNLVLLGGLLMSVLLALTARLIRVAGEREGVIAKANGHLEAEVVERRLAETRLREARSAAEAATRAKSEFLANMSHEIRSPMNAILGMADLLWESELSGEQREYLGAFRRAGTNLLTLINDILDIAKVESGKSELHPADFDLDEMLAALEIMRGRAQAKGLGLELHIAAGVPRALHGDADRLRQVLINLLGNAIKFTAAGEVRLDVGLEGPAGDRSQALRFKVTDTGPGIPPKKLALIFESFSQADSSIAQQFGGTGLGLTISRTLVELMGGRLDVSSEEGQGSVFTFAVRLGVAALPKPRPAAVLLPAPTRNDIASGRILLVEDSKDNQLLILAYLKHTAYQVEIAEDGQAALDRFSSGAFDLILMDVQMPVMDGYAATRKIREWEVQHTARPVPILALTANAMADESRKSRDAGCDAHLTKPIPKAALLRAIADHLRVREKIRVVAPDGLEELVPGYLKNLRADLQSLGAALQKQDYRAIEVTGHQMKGSGAGYGFPAITDIGRKLEVAAKAATSEGVQAEVWALADYLNRVATVHSANEVVATP